MPSKERQLALDILHTALGGRKLDRVFEDTASIFENDTKTRMNQVYNLVYGVARRHFSLSAYIDSKVREKLPIKANLILEIGLYELAFNKSSKDYAVISDALKLADFLNFKKYKPVINAVLRRFADDMENGVKSLLSQKQVPAYVFDEMKKTFGDNATRIMHDLMAPSPLFLSVNTILVTPGELISLFKNQGIDVEKVNFEIKEKDGSSHSFSTLRTFEGKIFKTPEFEKGLFMIQDFSSQIAVELLGSFSDMKMLDICSAPGGKAITAAIKASDKANITAIDISSSRLFRVHENINRMNIKSINVISADFIEHDFKPESFDRIFLDPPCSALGVMGRNPDVTWKKSPQLIKELSSLQLSMLLRAMDLLKKGGKMVHSVCTFTQLETTDVINNALSKNGNFRKINDPLYTIPNNLGMDGLFIAVLEKK